MGNAIFIVWRESLEAVLIVTLLASILSARAMLDSYRKHLIRGVLGGVILSLLLAAGLLFIEGELAGLILDGFNVAIMFVAALLVVHMVVWMKTHSQNLKKEFSEQIDSSKRGVMWIAAFAIAREGAETVVYIYGLLQSGSLGGAPQVLGSLAIGIGMALSTAFFVSRGFKSLNYAWVFKITSILLLVSGASLVMSACSKMIDLGWLPSLKTPFIDLSGILDSSHGLGSFLAHFAGYRSMPSLMQVLCYLGFWFLYFFWSRSHDLERNIKMNRLKVIVLLLMAPLLMVSQAHALNMFELEVYPYATEPEGIVEFENSFNFSKGTEKEFGTTHLYESFEIAYSPTDRIELALYTDWLKDPAQNFGYQSTRARARYRFAEKGEHFVDLGAYLETTLPRGGRGHAETELKLIAEKDFGDFTFDLNPGIEMALSGDEVEPEPVYAAALVYRMNETFMPALEFFGTLESPAQQMISPMARFRFGHGLKVNAGAGFGTTSATDRYVARTQIEYEF